MTSTEKTKTDYYLTRLMTVRAATGAGIALCLLTVFLWGIEPDPLWPKYWMLRPYIIVPLAGATGGICFHILDRYFYGAGWKRVLANICGVIIYIIGLWLGSVLGLDGTLWN